MAICRFYQQGNCRYGNACRFEHPPKPGQQSQGGNRFSALAGGTNQQAMGGRSGDTPQYPGLTAELIQRELSSELPQWILSCYGPGRDAPEQLFGGYPREQSFEEVRLHWMQGVMNGNPQAALNEIQALYQNAQQQIQHTLNNLPAAIQYVVDGINKHPNRIDICKSGGAAGAATNAFQTQAPPTNPFGTPATPATTGSAFGQPTALGQQPSPFGGSAFGQPATLGAGSPFGRPGQTASAFGQTSTLGPKPSPFGTPAFSQPAQPTPSAFAQPSPFAPATTSAQPATGLFGPPTQANPFASPASSAPVNNVFAKPPATISPFTQPAAAPANPFGQPAQQPAAGPFSTPAAPATTSNAFAPPTQPTQSSPFAAPATNVLNTQPSTSGSAFGNTGTTSSVPASSEAVGPYGPGSTRQHPDISTYSTREANGMLRMFKGKPVTYETPKGAARPIPFIRNFDGTMVKIWMPDGAPRYTAESEAEPQTYEDPKVQEQWRPFLETGRFVGGIMPEVPPKREFCTWDF